jgi:Mlc titration factor MtfA (ptsG expression regulator)
MSPELVFATLGLALAAALALYPTWARWRHRRLHQRPFPAAWRQLLRRQFPLYNRLPPPLQKRLQGLVQVFVADVSFIGCQGLRVTDAMRVLVAAQACLLVLERPGGPPYPDLRQVLLYPGPFVVKAEHHQPGGVVSQGREVRLGESWQHGQVVLSWPDALAGAKAGVWGGMALDASAHNVVWHEFAHQLDQETGPANGAPVLRHGQSQRGWAAVFQREYEDLRWLTDAGEPTLIDPYGATAPEEFFAVVTETFFLHPQTLAHHHPALYEQLRFFYGLNPAQWA